jgi:hypothetical protein
VFHWSVTIAQASCDNEVVILCPSLLFPRLPACPTISLDAVLPGYESRSIRSTHPAKPKPALGCPYGQHNELTNSTRSADMGADSSTNRPMLQCGQCSTEATSFASLCMLCPVILFQQFVTVGLLPQPTLISLAPEATVQSSGVTPVGIVN